MNALRLYHDLKKRDIYLEADGEDLKVDAPAGAVTEEDKVALVELKPILLKFLAGAQGPYRPSQGLYTRYRGGELRASSNRAGGRPS